MLQFKWFIIFNIHCIPFFSVSYIFLIFLKVDFCKLIVSLFFFICSYKSLNVAMCVVMTTTYIVNTILIYLSCFTFVYLAMIVLSVLIVYVTHKIDTIPIFTLYELIFLSLSIQAQNKHWKKKRLLSKFCQKSGTSG